MKTVSYRTYRQALDQIQEELGQERLIYIYNTTFELNEPIQLGVNWAAIGTVPAAEARAFAEKLLKATTLAETFGYNGYTITWQD